MAIAKKKQKFWNVDIPSIEKETQLFAFDTKDLDGKFISYDLTRVLKGKSAILQAVIEVSDDKATAIAKQIKLLPYYMKRMVRKGTNYVEDSFSTEANDAIVKFKPFLVTRRKVSRAVRKALRNKTKEELITYAKKTNSQDIIKDILRNNLQKQLSLTLKKIYPLSSCEIRTFKIEKVTKKIKPEEKAITKTSEEERAIIKTPEKEKPIKKKTTPSQKESPKTSDSGRKEEVADETVEEKE